VEDCGVEVDEDARESYGHAAGVEGGHEGADGGDGEGGPLVVHSGVTRLLFRRVGAWVAARRRGGHEKQIPYPVHLSPSPARRVARDSPNNLCAISAHIGGVVVVASGASSQNMRDSLVTGRVVRLRVEIVYFF